MPFETPWAVNGAEHSAALARLLPYATLGGAEGIVEPTDLRVSALAVPGGAVQVSRGGAFVLNRSSGARQQTYVGSLTNTEQVTIEPTGSSGKRSDLIVARVEDPSMAGGGWQIPADPAAGPYMHLRVIQGVPAGTTRLQDIPAYANQSGIALARIDLPASTGTVTDAMIVSLREVARPRRETRLLTYAMVKADAETLTATSAYPAGEYWPNVIGDEWDAVLIPTWATRCKLVMMWGSVILPPGNSWGSVWVQIGNNGDANRVATQDVGFDAPNSSGNTRQNFIAADDRYIPAVLRGTRQKFRPRGRLAGTSGASARPKLDALSSMTLQLEFTEVAD